MSTLIKNGRIVTAVDDYNADIFIEDEKITQIGKNLEMGRSEEHTSELQSQD